MQPLELNEDLCTHQKKEERRWTQYWQKVRRFFQEDWGWEVISYIGSVCSMVIMVVVLACYDGKVRSERPSRITLNTIVAIGFGLTKGLMIICVSACIGQFRFLSSHRKSLRLVDVESYNAASQSTLGALWLLVNSRAAKASLVGAFVVVAALAVDPFVQQLLNYATLSVPISTEASLDVSLGGDMSVMDIRPQLDMVQERMPDEIMGHKFYAPDRDYHICPSNHCEWPEYSTLGVCSECIDVTPRLGVERDPDIRPGRQPGDVIRRAFLPNGHELENRDSEEDCGYDITEVDYNITTRTSSWGDCSALTEARCWKKGHSPVLADLTAIYLFQHAMSRETFSRMSRKKGQSYDKYFGNLSSTFLQRTSPACPNCLIFEQWSASQCTLNLCLQRRKASVREGRFQDELLDKFVSPLDCSRLQQFNHPDNGYCALAYEGAKLDFTCENSDRSPYCNLLRSCPGHIPTKEVSEYTWWGDKNPQSAHNASTINCLLISPRVLSWQLFYLYNGLEDVWSNRAFTTSKCDTGQEHDPSMAFSHADILATQMTNWFRRSEPRNSTNGTVYGTKTFVQVDWLYTSLPIVLLCCTFMTLLLTIRETRQTNVRVWKTSTLPLLLDGLDFTNESDYHVDITESQERASKTPLLLHRFWRAISMKGNKQSVALR